MSEEIVACPGCAKKFRIPQGAPGGSFQCTACSADVPYGKAPRVAAAAASSRSAPSRSSRAAGASSASRGGGSSRQRARVEDDYDDRRRAAPPKDNSVMMMCVVGGVVVAGVVAFVLADKKTEPDPAPKKPDPVATAPVTPAPTAPSTAPPVAPPTTNPAPTAPAGGSDGMGAPEIGPVVPNTGLAGTGSMDSLMVRIPDIEGVTPQERAAIEKDVALYCDQDAGMLGNDAGARLRKLGRKAIPALLSTFESQWKTTKWDNGPDKWKAAQVQQMLVAITKASRPGGDFVAHYVPSNHKEVVAEDFQKAAKMWVNWWNGIGSKLTKFKEFAD